MAERKKTKQAPAEETTRPAAKTVGEVLRAARLARGYEYEDVSTSIHIRSGQLKAIEEGDIEALPGMTYAIGFVRSYANFLGLNGAEVVHQFKVEQGYGLGPAKLAFPEPVVESRTPDMTMVGVGGFLAVAMLIGWAVYSNVHGSKSAETIPPAPAEVASIATTVTVPVATNAAMPGPDAAPVAAASAAAPSSTAAVPADATAAATLGNSPATVSTTVPTTATPLTAVTTPAATPAQMTPAPAAAMPETAAKPETAAAVKEVPVTDEAKKDEANKDAAADEDVINIKKPKSRIVLKAVQDGWVQVMDENQNIIYKKVLRKGEQYAVPDQPGLSLDTANAGGLSVIVDGKSVAALGESGDIVRGVVLDPAGLKARRAPRRSRSAFQE